MTNQSDYLVTMNDPNSVPAEAFRTLRTNLFLRDFDNKIKVINVISASAQESKSTTILNLAVSFSQINKKVLLIDLDLRLPTIHKKLKIKNKVGITDVVSKQAKYEEAVFHYSDNFDVLFAGTKIPFAAEFIQSKACQDFIEKLKSYYDYIFIDCPPIGAVADGLIVSEYCDGTIMCCEFNRNEKRDLIRSKEAIERLNINLLGIVFTRMPMTKKYYNYDYKYRYEDSAKKAKK